MPRQQKVSQWKFGTTVSKADNADSLSMAEPQHRLFNRGESNISTHNDFPSTKSSAQQIKDICMHYVKKCSGQYSNNRAAARYVHQMADEVLNQISGLIGQISRIESEPEAYQALLQEFRDAFPSNLQSPKQVAAKLYKLQEDYDRVVATIESMRLAHKKELESVASSVNEQIKAYKDGIIKERRHHKTKIDNVSVEYNQKAIEETSRILAEKADMENHYLRQIHNLETQSSTEISQLKSRVNTLENELKKAKDNAEDLDDENKELETEIMQLKSKLRRLEDEEGLFGSKTPRSEFGDMALDMATMSSDMGSVMGDFDDDKSVLSSYSVPLSVFPDTQTASTIEIKDGTQDDGTNKGKEKHPTASKERSGGEKGNRSSSRANSQYLRMAKSMKKRLMAAKLEKKALEDTVSQLNTEMQSMKDNNKLLVQKVRDIIEVNKELKKALSSKYKIDVSKEAPVHVTAVPHPLHHTPHFLGRRDTSQLRTNLSQHIFKGVQGAGKF